MIKIKTPRRKLTKLAPIARGMAWMLLRALQDDVAPDDLCGATAGPPWPRIADGITPCWRPK